MGLLFACGEAIFSMRYVRTFYIYSIYTHVNTVQIPRGNVTDLPLCLLLAENLPSETVMISRTENIPRFFRNRFGLLSYPLSTWNRIFKTLPLHYIRLIRVRQKERLAWISCELWYFSHCRDLCRTSFKIFRISFVTSQRSRKFSA